MSLKFATPTLVGMKSAAVFGLCPCHSGLSPVYVNLIYNRIFFNIPPMFSRSPAPAFLRLILILSIVGLSACGFRLRGSGDTAEILGPVYVTSQGYSAVADDLRRFLKESDVLLSEKSENSVLQVDIESEQTSRRSLTIGTDSQVRDIELTYSVNLTIKKTGDEEAIPERILVTRTYTFDVTGVLGSADEEELLFRDMRFDLVRRLLERLASFSWDATQ